MKILLVEDEENPGSLLKEELEEQGYSITWLRNGVDAVLAALDNRFDVLIVDMVMPDMSGINTIRIIKKIIPGIGIVACSGKVEKDIMIDSIMTGAAAYLNKPFSTSKMISQIKWVTRKKVSCSSNL
ncbi:MAG: response regulator transcription factor [Deltaproteobacteria bacterium]|nr:response regulator transcription factor [Deltaproteobacteria bacterium]